MRSYRLAAFGEPLQTSDEPTPQPEGTQVLLRVKASGVCHSDIHIWEGSYDLGGGRKMPMKGVPLPLTMGHETVGEVVAANLSREAILMTDEARHYVKIGEGYRGHGHTNHAAGEYVSRFNPLVHTNTVEGFFSIFKRSFQGRITNNSFLFGNADR